jgi:PAT family acetyl-CoA transporter-like MFS transporter 1
MLSGDSEKWGVPMLSLTWYLRFWAAVCFAVAAGLLLFKTEVRARVWGADTARF